MALMWSAITRNATDCFQVASSISSEGGGNPDDCSEVASLNPSSEIIGGTCAEAASLNPSEGGTCAEDCSDDFMDGSIVFGLYFTPVISSTFCIVPLKTSVS